jgi:S1-C subfamily serine protease
VCAQAFAAEEHGMNPRDVIQKVRKGVLRVQVAEVGSADSSVAQGGGSGFVFEIDYDQGTAYAITNYHVAGHASYVSVTAWNKAVYNGEMVATEPGIDITLIKVHGVPDERNLPDDQKSLLPIVLGDSDKVVIGEMALAMGSPGAGWASADRSDPYATFMLDQTANVNVVTGRQTPLDWAITARGGGDMHFEYATNLDYAFRMSTAINHGNSGGPLINNRGEVIGINTWTRVGTGLTIDDNIGQSNNMAVPINQAKDFVYQVLNTGKFEKPWLGLDIIFPSTIMTPFSDPMQAYVEFKERNRVPGRLDVYGVRASSPAAQAGLKPGDVIMDINGQKFQTPEDIRHWVFTQDIGTPLSLRIKRDGKVLHDPIVVKVGVKRGYDAEFSV